MFSSKRFSLKLVFKLFLVVFFTTFLYFLVGYNRSNDKDVTAFAGYPKTHGNTNSIYGENSCEDRTDIDLYRQILKFWVQTANKLNISYFLTAGTLIGIMRDGELIPWDHDIDIMLLHQDTEKLEPLKSSRPVEFLTDYKVRIILQEQWRLPGKNREIRTCENKTSDSYSGICGFRYILGRVLKNTAYMDMYEYRIKDRTVTDEWNTYKYDDIYPLTKCNFMGVEALCPRNPLPILHHFYGPNFRHPDRKCVGKEWKPVCPSYKRFPFFDYIYRFLFCK